MKEALQKLIEVKPYAKQVDDFAKKKFDEQLALGPRPGTWIYYSGYEVISESQIKVIYRYGIGDRNFNGSFLVDIE